MRIFVGILVIILISIVALHAQANLDVRKMPELGAHIVFDPIVDPAKGLAVSYNWYENSRVGDCTDPVWISTHPYIFDHNQKSPIYDDSPFPGWYKVNVNNRGSWQHNWWCYEIEPVFADGTIGQRSVPLMVRVGSSGYVTLHYKSGSCTGPNILFPYTFAQLYWKIFYRDSAGINHEMNVIQVDSSINTKELEWKIPDIALDGTIVPLLKNGDYYYEIMTPDGFLTAGAITPYYYSDMAAYTQINVYKVLNGPNCPIGFGTAGQNYSFPQNVIR